MRKDFKFPIDNEDDWYAYQSMVLNEPDRLVAEVKALKAEIVELNQKLQEKK